MIVVILCMIMRVVFSNALIDHCVIYDEANSAICIRCDIGYVLDQASRSCVQTQKSSNGYGNYCIQISNFGECIRCDCGYGLSEELEICQPTLGNLIGCETFKQENICTRPKSEYFLVVNSGNNTKETPLVASVQFDSGSHCEIFDLQGKCTRCHSGFILDHEHNCQRVIQQIANEFFGYYSFDGELKSRFIQFKSTRYGIYPQILFCDVYSEQKNEFSSLQCEKCSLGKALNRSKTICLKIPFDRCGIVSDSDHSLCEECLDNDYFYLSRDDQNQQQICLPRSQFLDPTTRCLFYYLNYPECQSCATGLTPTTSGCDLNDLVVEIEDSADSNLIYRNDYSSFVRYQNCNVWISQIVCGECKKGMVLNNKGKCEVQKILSCFHLNEAGGCQQCGFLKYYNEEKRVCDLITNVFLCRSSSGVINECEKCRAGSIMKSNGMCYGENNLNCVYKPDRFGNCEICINLFFLEKQNDSCTEISYPANCLYSDGIHDDCLKCKRSYELNYLGACVSQFLAIDGYCVDQRQYFDGNTRSCVKYDFENSDNCFLRNTHQNNCLECEEGYYLEKGICFGISNCRITDGIRNWCFEGFFSNSYVNDLGKVEISSMSCLTNGILDVCTYCLIPGDIIQGISSSDGKCIFLGNKLIENEQIFYYCLHLSMKNTNEYFCDLCIKLYFPDVTGQCTEILDNNCRHSDGQSNVCLLCARQYKFNEKTNLCEIEENIVIPFCEIIKLDKCAKCQSLFYPQGNSCQLISDPDCESSDGIGDRCQKCKNQGFNLDLKKKGMKLLCFQLLKIAEMTETNKEKSQTNNSSKMEFEMELNSLQIVRIIIFQLPKLFFFSPHYHQPGSIIEELLNCKTIDLSSLNCIECNDGYFFDELYSKSVCSLSDIQNCLKVMARQNYCLQCAEGYFLLSSQVCAKVPNCEEFSITCLKCSESTFLKDGVCVQLKNCWEQRGKVCVRCNPGYWLLIGDTGQSVNGKQEEVDIELDDMQNEGLSENIGKLKTSLFIEEEQYYECKKILHCQESDGINVLCDRCDNNYQLINEMCVKINHQDLDNCQEFSQNNDKKQQCIRCQNLFFLVNSSFNCVQINDSHCSYSDGINDSCRQCTFDGYKLTDQGTCQKIDNCEISNGMNSCVACRNDFIVDFQGECQEIQRKINNCDIYYYQEIPSALTEDNFPDVNQLTNELKQRDNFDRPARKEEQQDDNTGNQSDGDIPGNYLNTFQKSVGCIKCSSLFAIQNNSNSQGQCMPLIPLKQTNCVLSTGIARQCSICKQGYYVKQANFDSILQCLPSKKYLSSGSNRCEYFDKFGLCIKCFDGLYLGSYYTCYPRRNSLKCRKFNKQKDECLECQNGFKMKVITENDIERKICMKIQGFEIVQHCDIYEPNGNKCKICEKSINKDVVMYVLNKKNNMCEYVLHLMCKRISSSSKGCDQKYISNCLLYSNNGSKELDGYGGQQDAGCQTCKNGYYLEKDNRKCTQHEVIQNCLVYSKTSPNTCEKCRKRYILKEQTACQPMLLVNCQILEKDSKNCQVCKHNFAVLITTGECIESHIRHCQRFTNSLIQSGLQICQGCRKNFFLDRKENICKLKLLDMNCKRVNTENNECLECNDGFFLNSESDCISKNSHCKVSNCLEYDVKSTYYDILCKECLPNYILNQDFKCFPLDPESNLTQSTTEEQMKIEEERQRQQRLEDWNRSFLVLLIIACIIGLLLYQLWKTNRTQRHQQKIDKVTAQDVSYTNQSNIKIQLEQSMQTMGHNQIEIYQQQEINSVAL